VSVHTDGGDDDTDAVETAARRALAEVLEEDRHEVTAAVSALSHRLRDGEPVDRSDLFDVLGAVDSTVTHLADVGEGFTDDVDEREVQRRLAATISYGVMGELLNVDLDDAGELAAARAIVDDEYQTERGEPVAPDRELKRARRAREHLAELVRDLDSRIHELKVAAEYDDTGPGDGSHETKS
jgi:hypothetical protein